MRPRQGPGQLGRGLPACPAQCHPQRAGHAGRREDHAGGVPGQRPVQVSAEGRVGRGGRALRGCGRAAGSSRTVRSYPRTMKPWRHGLVHYGGHAGVPGRGGGVPARPRARNAVVLTVTEDLRVGTAALSQAAPPQAAPSQAARLRPPRLRPPGPRKPGPRPPRQALARTSHCSAGRGSPGRPDRESAGPVGAVCMHTPTFPILLSQVSGRAAAELPATSPPPGASFPASTPPGTRPTRSRPPWRERTGDAITVTAGCACSGSASSSPGPGTRGSSQVGRRTGPGSAGRMVRRLRRRGRRPAQARQRRRRRRAPRLRRHHGLGGRGVPVSVAGLTRAVAGMVRVGPVYTPPELRGRGYAGAVTAAVSQAALEAGLREVVLYTDLANPTSNALYQRLGYRPVEDRVLFSFAPGGHGLRFTRERTQGLCPVGRR